ncbi:Acyl transferase domain-containing protein [Nitrosospira sp. Nsp14]|uniref:type I polyketide synthase n=1 Tax=Nitrosospira sp. Nsp14 TaxID=1855333 RepID=UPI0008DFD6EE|nr:type I polyketide synthase [Nitrosospira sp. Nsp14]SFH30738.1 Acyl transferase domain-containing protein [Nitrosospira sp. Nsp14]
MQHEDEFPESSGIEIAIVGMAGRFPGASDIDAFWRNLRDGVESITPLSDEDLLARGASASELADPLYVKAIAQLDGIDLFDASFFGYSPREAAEMDPQHRLFLETAWKALEDAGYDTSTYRDLVGVYAGCGVNTYLILNLLSSGHFSDMRDISSLQGLMNGNNKDSMTTTVSYKLNLRGPAVTVQTACSTSLAAVHVACRGLLNHEADMALAGGVWVNLLHDAGYHYQPGAILSPDGHCRAFDAQAAGTVIGSGVGIVVLKRLADALADGDTIHAVIKGSAINNDGSAKVGYTAPSVEGQAEVILAAQAISGISADTISYVEAHGTGTTMGDPIEIEALTQAFRESTQRQGFCGIGSVKTNVGHLDAAAGVAGLIKTALALEHQMLPPSLNFERPNPQIDFSNSPFYVNATGRHWADGSTPRRAGVSSFGIGGTNVHAILEEAPPARQSGPSRDWQILMLSARSSHALEAMTERLGSHLETHHGAPLADAAYTLQIGRRRFSHRAITLCSNTEDAIVVLKSRDPQRFLTGQVAPEDPSVVFMFPGQGAQHVDMARDLYRGEAVFREEFDRCIDITKPFLDFDLLALLYPGTDEANRAAATMRLAQTEVTQPALFIIEYSLAKLWMSWGVLPAAMIGHSVGEYVAACLSGVLSLEDALKLVSMRGRLLQGMEAGAMLAVMLPEGEITPYLNANCDLAAVNGPELCVMSGTPASIEAVEKLLTGKGITARRLHVSHAFHSAMTEPLLPSFVEMVGETHLRRPTIPFLSNLSGDWITPSEATDPNYWGKHLRGTVRFGEGLSELLSKPANILLEVGPGETLTTLAQRHPDKNPEQVVLSSLPHPGKTQMALQHFFLTLGKLWLKGVNIKWEYFYAEERRNRVSLPAYPFERLSYWVKPKTGNASNSMTAVQGVAEGHGLSISSLDEWFYAPSWRRSERPVLRDAFAGEHGSVVVFTDEHYIGPDLVARLRTYGIKPIVIRPDLAFRREDEDFYTVRPGHRQDYDLLLGSLRDDGRTIGRIFYLWSIDGGIREWPEEESWARNFFSLFYLAQAMESNKALDPSRIKVEITVVTNGLEDVTGNEQLYPEKSLLLGPCKVIPQEYSYLDCRIIDIELQSRNEATEARLVEQILAESQADSVSSVVAYRGPHRWVQCFEPVRLPPPQCSVLRQEGAYLITGGLGGVGLTLAEYLAKTCKARLVLLGRSPIPSREQWSSLLADNGSIDSTARGKIEKILQLEALGAEVLVVQADVAITSELEGAVAEAHKRFGPIHGVIHAAGEVGSGLISAKTEAMVARIFSPKVQGTRALQAVFKDEGLDFMLLCSSLAAIAGGLSKVDYCAANAYLDAIARAASHESAFPIISINWDGWREVGMAANMAMPAGVGIAPQEGAEVFERIVSGVIRPQIIVSTLELNSRLSQSQDDLVAQPLTFAVAEKQGRYPRPALQTILKLPESDLEKAIAEVWQTLLGMDAIGIDDNLFELGGDSLLGIQLLSRVRAGFAVDLHPADFFRSPTIAGLAALVETKLIDEIECS